jgi:hypothetical protein
MKFSKEGYAIEGDLDVILFNSVDSTIPTWPTFKLFEVDAELALVNMEPLNLVC